MDNHTINTINRGHSGTSEFPPFCLLQYLPSSPLLYPQLAIKLIAKLLLIQKNQAGTSLVVMEVTDEFITY
jgi:hypothetical protein